MSVLSWTKRRLDWKREFRRLAAHVSALGSDFEKTTFLRTYTGELIGLGFSDKSLTNHRQFLDQQSCNLPDLYALFKTGRAGAECGVTSLFYVKLLLACGFKAYQYSFGFRKEPYRKFIHSVALVEIKAGQSKRLIIQDPYLSSTYQTQSGEPMDFFEFLSVLKRRDYQLINLSCLPLETWLHTADIARYDSYLNREGKALLAAALRQNDGSMATRLRITRSYDNLMRSPFYHFESAFEEALRKHAFSEPFLFAYTLRASEMAGAKDRLQLQRRIDELLR